MVGYAVGTKGYRVWVPKKKQIFESVHVVFDESQSYKSAEDNVLDPVDLTFNFNDTDSDDETGVPGRSNDLAIPGERKVTYNRIVKKRKLSDQKEVYYYPSIDPMQRLRSLSDAKRFCERNDIKYNPSEFDFKTKYVLRATLPDVSEELPDVSEELPDVSEELPDVSEELPAAQAIPEPENDVMEDPSPGAEGVKQSEAESARASEADEEFYDA
ncbi:hypothetical protein CHUAL_000045 [Chamberlinius hualienensis]